MKRFSLLFAFVAMLCVSANSTIILDHDLKAALPSGQYFLPAPPTVGSLVWQDDSILYFQYKEASRKWDEQKEAYWDSIWGKMNEPYYFAIYRLGADSVMDLPFYQVTWTKKSATKYTVDTMGNWKDFPKTLYLERLCEQMKEDNTSGLWRTRPRPYCYFGDWYSGKKYAKDLTNASSYPSGHGYFAGLFGMAMLYIDPDHSLAIKKMMDEWAECRLIVGAHWNTDVIAGKQLGAMAFAIAMNYDQFKNAVEDAKTELKNYRATHQAAARIPDDQTNGRNLAQTQLYVTSQLSALKDAAQPIRLEISRTFFCDGYYNSLCLPFDIAENDWSDAEKNPLAEGTLKRFVKAEVIDKVLNITIETATSVEAGVPYLIKFEQGEDIVNPVFKGIQVATTQSDSTTSEAMNCNGTFIPRNIPTGENAGYLILGANNALYWPKNDGEYLRGFRAYFHVNDNPSGAPMRGLKAQLTEPASPTANPSVYQCTNVQIYKLIDDGQVIIVRGGVKYDVQGQIR